MAPPLCRPVATGLLARAAGLREDAVQTTPQPAATTPQCVFRAGRIVVSALDDTAPQAYFRLERTIVEQTQVFTPQRQAPAPVTIRHLGLDAAWFPGTQQVMSTDGVQLVTASVRWPGAPVARRRALAIAVVRAYLGPLHPEAADPSSI